VAQHLIFPGQALAVRSYDRHMGPTMMRWIVALWAVLGAVAVARADDWAAPTTKYVKSESGRYRAVIVPGAADGKKRAGSITLYDDVDAVHPKRLYQRKLVNEVAPVQILVADGGQLVTVDEWSKAGYKHVVVIYDKKGKVVVDCALEQVLLAEEILTVDETESSRWWRAKEQPVWLEEGALMVKTAPGPVIRFELSTGAQSRDGQRVSIGGSDRCRGKKK
jgi:hypothetical protein